MLARLLWAVLFVEFTLNAVLGIVLVRHFGWTIPGVFALAAGGGLAVRAIITAHLFTVAWVHRAVRTGKMRIGPLATLRLLLVEYLWLLLIYYVLHPFQRLVMPLDPARGPHAGPPILLIHGYVCNAGYWWGLRRALARAGFAQTYAINLEPVFGRIPDYAEQVGARVREIQRATDAEKVVLIGHSMGGLVARAWVNDPANAARVARVIAIGSPFLGTAHAERSFGENATQMRRINAWLQEQNTAPPPETPFVSIFSYHDELVAPQDSSELNFATNHPLAGIGHLELAFSKPVQEIVLATLRENATGARIS